LIGREEALAYNLASRCYGENTNEKMYELSHLNEFASRRLWNIPLARTATLKVYILRLLTDTVGAKHVAKITTVWTAQLTPEPYDSL